MLTKKDVEHVAGLARLRLEEDEKEEYAKQLGQIVEWMGNLEGLELEGVEPTAHILPVQNVFREDRVHEGFTSEEALQGAPDRKGRFFKVPVIMSEEENGV
ncbi:MAG: Asp-tRNA(Asn)/Glu-tRNA(Gln) amidotransferase subunit GatC [Halanaerobium sp.]|nr:Asp-tRNA(Asn)/Glu-tRNA(Gln) amidotransferase subunit GatC [Halanaerobium sp.]